MPEFEKDFMLRQAKDLAKGLGDFLTEDSLEELLPMEERNAQLKESEKDRFKGSSLHGKKDKV